jgi:site-specific recombinase XerD
MTVNFVCRASKARKDGQSPIELSIIINGERSIITLDRKVNYKNFNPSNQRVKGDKELNEYLDIIKKKCYNLEAALTRTDNLTLDNFIHSFKHGLPQKTDTILKTYDSHNMLYKGKVASNEVNHTSYTKYINNRNRLAEYIRTMGMSDIRLRDITPSFIEGFKNFCLMNLKTNTANKELKMIKKILAFAVKERLLEVSPFNLVLREEKLDYDVLSLDNIKYLIGLQITDKRMDSIRDLFCLQSLTGLSYSDMASLSIADIQDDVIVKRRKKTNVQFVIPLLPITKQILEKYNYELPIISNQKYNAYLKVLGDYAKLPMSLHSHLARHSYACILINSGVDLKTISRSLGHSSIKMTEKTYAFMSNKTVVDNILEKIKI